MPIDDKTDSFELQTLFDSIAASSSGDSSPAVEMAAAPSVEKAAPPPAEPPAAAPSISVARSAGLSSQVGEASDDELQSLFDAVYADQHNPSAAASALSPLATQTSPDAARDTTAYLEDTAEESQDMFQQIGQMTRRLHSMLRELGYEETLQRTAAETIPDTRQRLEYITEMTEQAAQKVLSATEIASPLVETIGSESKALSNRWDSVFRTQVSPDQFRQLAVDTKEYLSQTQERADIARAKLIDIMMAQDFQDLTGQVIKKVIDLAQDLESQLLVFLIDNIPSEKRSETESLMNGPVINPTSRDDVVTDQIQVDDLLESLGF